MGHPPLNMHIVSRIKIIKCKKNMANYSYEIYYFHLYLVSQSLSLIANKRLVPNRITKTKKTIKYLNERMKMPEEAKYFN